MVFCHTNARLNRVPICILFRLRQYPMYDKKSPPDALAHKFEPETFQKSQVYGRDKARFSLVSSAYDQTLEVLLLYFDAQAWAWTLAGSVLEKRGYEGYEVCIHILQYSQRSYYLNSSIRSLKPPLTRL